MFVQAARYMHNHNANEDEMMKFRCYGVEKEPDTVKENKTKAKGLFVRFDNAGSPQVKVCRNLISIFDGTTDVFFYYCDTKKYEKVFLADVNDALLKELRKILGNGNIVYNE